jgi:hypothetical protein
MGVSPMGFLLENGLDARATAYFKAVNDEIRSLE